MSMEKINYIQNKEVIPDTHVFVYKDRKYPFKFDYFKYASEYFCRNQKELSETKTIKLFDSETEKHYSISSESIENFIQFVQSEKIIVNVKNVIELNLLSNKYEVSTLKEKTDEYIEKHQEELVLDLLLEKQNDIYSKTYELIISKNLHKYVEDPRLLNLNVSVLYRILSGHYNYNNNEMTEKIFHFLLKCVEKFGIDASVLFENVIFGENKRKYVQILIDNYSNRFDFSYISKAMIEVIKEQELEIQTKETKYNEIITNKTNEISKMKEQINSIEIDNKALNTLINKKEQEHLSELENQRQILNKNKTEYEKKLSNKNEEIAKIRNEKENLQEEISKQKMIVTNIKNEYENSLSTKTIENNRIIKQKEEMNERNKILLNENTKLLEEIKQKEIFYSSEINKLKKDIENKNKEINECKQQGSGIPFLYKQNDEFNGIIKYLTNKTGGNIHDNGTIEVTSRTFWANSSKYRPKNLLNFNDDSVYESNNASDEWIKFDFKNQKIKIMKYQIKSYSSSKNTHHLKSWFIEVSNDGENWTKIDERLNCQELNGPYLIGTFDVKPNNFSRYVRLSQIDKTWGGFYSLLINYLEFYGYIDE